MCTVTYLPCAGQGFVLTSNRDESISRKSSLPPSKYNINNISVFYPKDQQAEGTWIATAPNHFTLCLLNGAFQTHVHKPPYRKSRGLVLLDFFFYNSVDAYISEYDYTDIEPFTMIVLNDQRTMELFELRWDGDKLHHKRLDATLPYIWSSSTLYKKEIVEQREQWFQEWLELNPAHSPDQVLSFHHFGGNGDAYNDLVMDTKEKKTVSITSIIREEASRTIVYEDLVHKTEKRYCIY